MKTILLPSRRSTRQLWPAIFLLLALTDLAPAADSSTKPPVEKKTFAVAMRDAM